MKKYAAEITILLAQLLMFYVFPLSAGPADAMGMVFLIIVATFLLSAMLGALSGRKIKFLYPVAVAVLFLPSVFIYYNASALVHSLWYLVISAAGLAVGAVIRILFCKRKDQ